MNPTQHTNAGEDKKNSIIRENGSKNTGNIFVARHPLCIAGIVCNYVPSSVCFGQFRDRPQYCGYRLDTVAIGQGHCSYRLGHCGYRLGHCGYRMMLSHPHTAPSRLPRKQGLLHTERRCFTHKNTFRKTAAKRAADDLHFQPVTSAGL